MNSFGVEKATTIRYPTTANLMVDSQDEVQDTNTNCGSLLFRKNNAFQNGFFTRLAITELCLQYNIPNIIGVDASGFQFRCDISGTTSNTLLRVPNGFYNYAEFIDAIAASMNSVGVFGTVSVIENYMTPQGVASGTVAIQATSGFRFSASQPLNYSGTLLTVLNVPSGGTWTTVKRIQVNQTNRLGVNTRYLDFVSPQITYAQDLKDSNTTPGPYDVLARWYFSYTDQTPQFDKYGFIIPYGSYPINERRIFNPPKQIKWDSNLPLGNFQVDVLKRNWGISEDTIFPLSQTINAVNPITGQGKSNAFNYLFTLQLSEN